MFLKDDYIINGYKVRCNIIHEAIDNNSNLKHVH